MVASPEIKIVLLFTPSAPKDTCPSYLLLPRLRGSESDRHPIKSLTAENSIESTKVTEDIGGGRAIQEFLREDGRVVVDEEREAESGLP